MSLVESWGVVEQFEERVAAYCGSRYAVAVDTCTAGLFLCLRHKVATADMPYQVRVPAHTYLGVACAVVHAGFKPEFHATHWQGCYSIGHGIIDSACQMRRGCYQAGSETCLSFQYRKHLKIGRGGMVLTDDGPAADWFRKARFLGRSKHNGVPEFVGWHAFMEPERAARGMVLMDSLPDHNPDLVFEYPDLRDYEVLSR